MLRIQTFDNRSGGNVTYKALAHPLAAEAMERLFQRLEPPVALFDPDGIAEAVLGLHPGLPRPAELFVQDVTSVGTTRAGMAARALTDLPVSGAKSVLVAAFDAGRLAARIAHLVPRGASVVTLDDVRLPDALLTNRARYLDKLNFVTNFAFFRDQSGLSTRVVSTNYWAAYGAADVHLWLRLFSETGGVLATWELELPAGPGGFSIDSRDVRKRFGLDEFTGQLFIHAVGAAGHDVVKYALDTYASDNGASLSCTHDANAWPADRYAGLPAPDEDENERVLLWVQNSHAVTIGAGALTLDRMGADMPVPLPQSIPPFASVSIDVAELLPDVHWPAQIELRAGRHLVRPRYEVWRGERVRIAHVNVERADLRPDPAIPTLPQTLGRGYLLPFPILPRDRFRSIVQPTPMAETQTTLPVRLDIFDTEGRKVAERFLGCLPRSHDVAVDFDNVELDEGHAELVYDFRDGGTADGWLHALFRYEDRQSGHAAESSFGAHVFNTFMTYRDEPQSYSGPPPGLSTRLFLKLGDGRRDSFAVLIYPASAAWHARSDTVLQLHASDGTLVAEEPIAIACSGSATVWPHRLFPAAAMQRAGRDGYVLVRDTTCRLFGYHGLMDTAGSFSLDHMFGF